MYVSAVKKDSVRYLLKVPIPQLPAYASPSSAQKENAASQVTFDKKWNPDSQDSGQKDESLSANEKSYTEAAQKILRIKTMELENKVQLLIIENERLTTFLNDQFQETEKLNNDMLALQQAGDERQRYFEEKVNIMIIENEKLQSVNRSLEAKVDSLMLQKRQLQTQKEEESKLLRDEMSLNIQKSATEIQFQSQTVQLQKNMEQLLSQNSELEKVVQDQQLCIEELAQNNKKKDEQLIECIHLKGDLQSKVKLIETLNSTMHNQENKINNLEQRLDIMVTENSKITSVVDELKQKEKLLSQALKDRQVEYQKEQQHNKELYEKEIKSLALKHKQQIDELNFNSQQSIRKAQLDIEEQLMGEFDNLKFELEVKQNELVNLHVLHKEAEEAKTMEFNRELMLKDQALENLQNVNQSLSEQMEQLQKLVERIQIDNDKAIQNKENEIVKLSKQLHAKDQQTKSLLQRLDDICKSLKELEEQRDLLSEEITEKSDRANQLEQRLDILIKENENLTNQLSIAQHQMEIIQIKSQNEQDKLKAQFEDDKIQLTLDQKVQFEQCMIQYQETIKYETDKSAQFQQDYKRSTEKQKHYELLSQQLTKELSKCNGRLEELIDVCEQSAQQLQQLEDQIRERDHLLDLEKDKYEKLQSNYEIELQTLQSQINDISQENSEISHKFIKAQEQSKQLEKQNRKTMEDLTIVTKHKLELDTKNKKMQNQLAELQQQSIQNSDLINRYKNQIHQHQQEVEELTRSFQQNFGEKELELQNKYDSIISELRSQVNSLTNKYNDIARKERDNRFRLKLLKSTQKLPDELNEDNCYQTMKSRIDDQSEYLQRLLIENEDLKKQLYATQSNYQSKPSSKKPSILVNAKPEYNEDTERTIKHVQTLGSSTKKVPIKIVQQFNSPSEKKQATNRFLDRDVYLQNNMETRKMLRQQSLQRI